MKNGFLNVLQQVKNGLRSGATLTIFFLGFALCFMAILKWGIGVFFGGVFFGGVLISMAYAHWTKIQARRNARGIYQPGSRGHAASDRGNSWDDDEHGAGIETTTVNPATGLPMIGGVGGFDAAGNPFGADLHSTSHYDTSWHHDSFHDHGSGHDFGSSTNDW